MPNISDKKIKEEMSKNENKHTPRFKALQILSNRIKDVVQSRKKIWKNVFDIKEEEDLPEVQTIEDFDPEKITIEVIASPPTTPPKVAPMKQSVETIVE